MTTGISLIDQIKEHNFTVVGRTFRIGHKDDRRAGLLRQVRGDCASSPNVLANAHLVESSLKAAKPVTTLLCVREALRRRKFGTPPKTWILKSSHTKMRYFLTMRLLHATTTTVPRPSAYGVLKPPPINRHMIPRKLSASSTTLGKNPRGFVYIHPRIDRQQSTR